MVPSNNSTKEEYIMRTHYPGSRIPIGLIVFMLAAGLAGILFLGLGCNRNTPIAPTEPPQASGTSV